MIHARDPDELYCILKRVFEEQGLGVLISGGSDKSGKVPLEPFIPVLKRIKQETDLILNVHTGFIDHLEAQHLAGAGVDIVSLDVVGSRETVRKVYGLDRGPNDYATTLRDLRKVGIPYVVPHITVGLHFGEIVGEIFALDLIKGALEPDVLIIDLLIPTRGTRMEHIQIPGNQDIIKVITKAVEGFNCPIVLGCMRPKGNIELERAAVDAGISGIVLPSSQVRREMEKRQKCRVVEACCATFPLMDQE